MLKRELEPEVMDTGEEAAEYQAMDHSEVNQRFAEDLRAFIGWTSVDGQFLDVGTGTALIPIACCQILPDLKFIAVDLSQPMLDLAIKNIAEVGLSDRIRVQLLDGKSLPFPAAHFSGVTSNSLIHHIPHPEEAFREQWRVLQQGGVWFHRDLLRPTDEPALEELVERYAGSSPHKQRQLLADSLRAALSLEELRAILCELGIPADWLRQTSDRHWTIAGRKP
ncbi:MAG: methyltransferase domain-containing protein [Planctomycetales bacterium]